MAKVTHKIIIKKRIPKSRIILSILALLLIPLFHIIVKFSDNNSSVTSYYVGIVVFFLIIFLYLMIWSDYKEIKKKSVKHIIKNGK